MDITFSAANTVGLNNPGTEIITLVKDGNGNFINPPSYDKMRAYLRSGEVPMLFVTDEAGETGSLYQLDEYSETENKIRFGNDKTTIEFSAGAAAPAVSNVVPKPLTYDYMPEGYPTKSVQTTTLMEEREVAFLLNNNVYVAQITNPPEIVEGQTYAVNWDGTAYECVCIFANSARTLGNLSFIDNGNDTGEPFLYVYLGKQGGGRFITPDTSASHTISVERIEKTVTPMAEEFLPAGVGTTAVITHVLSTNTYSSDLSYDELHEILLDHRQVVFWEPEYNMCSYMTKWAKESNGDISLAFGGGSYSVSLHTDGTIGKHIMT